MEVKKILFLKIDISSFFDLVQPIQSEPIVHAGIYPKPKISLIVFWRHAQTVS